jgi:hypothetical protein
LFFAAGFSSIKKSLSATGSAAKLLKLFRPGIAGNHGFAGDGLFDFAISDGLILVTLSNQSIKIVHGSLGKNRKK